ncbi:TatD family hydrolase [bacterium]|nr:TatD family hydrolase [bacterium]
MPTEPLFDSHCHLNDPAFAHDLDAVLARAREAGVTEMLVVGYDPLSSRRAVELAAAYPSLYAAVGIAPHSAQEYGPEALGEIAALAQHPRVVALGEAGLEYHHGPDHQRQKALFAAHIRLAEELCLPLVIHSRDADEDLWELIAREGLSRGVLHCFTGGAELLRRATARGLYVSISGIASFPKAGAVHAAARDCPAERLLIETDAPYLAPVPHRGARNQPAYLARTLEAVARLRRVAPASLAATTRHNALCLFAPLPAFAIS